MLDDNLPLLTMVGFLKRLGFKIVLGQDDYVPYIICTEKSVTVERDILDWLGFLGPLTRQKAEFLRLALFMPTVSVTLNRTTMIINTTALKSFIFILSHATAARLWSHLSLVELAISKYHEYRIAHMETQTDALMEILMQRPLNQPASSASSTRLRGSPPPAREHSPPPAYSEIPNDVSSQHRTIESPPPPPANNETSDNDMLHSNENDDLDQDPVSSSPSPAPRLRLECDESMPSDSDNGGDGGGEERNESARQQLVDQLISRAVHHSWIQLIRRRRQHRALRSKVRDA